MSPALTGGFFTAEPPGKPFYSLSNFYIQYSVIEFPWWLSNNLPVMQETQVQSVGQEDPLEKEMATHSIILAWEIPWTEEPGGLQSLGSQKSQTQWSNYTTTCYY